MILHFLVWSSAFTRPPEGGTPNLSHQKPQHMCAAVSEVANNDQRPRENYRGITADIAELHVTNGPSKPHDSAADRVNGSIDHADIEELPQSFARTNLDRLNDRRIVDLVHVVFVLQQSRHRAHRLSLDHEPTDADSTERNHHRDHRQ